MPMIRGVLFDKDGTLFDFNATWGAWVRAYLLDLSSDDEARAAVLGEAIGFDMYGASFAVDSVVIAGTPRDMVEALLPLLPGACPSSLLTRMNTAAASAPMVEAVPLAPLMAAFKTRGIRLGLATNDAEEPARAHLQAVGAEPYFDFVAGFDSGYGAKPQPGMLRAFADCFGLMPSEVVMVGDSRHDLIAARAAGMRAVGVLTGLATEADLAPLAEAVLPDIGHLAGWIDEPVLMESVA